MHRILLVDDEQNILKSLVRLLSRKSEWEVSAYSNPAEALCQISDGAFDLVLSDYRMPGMNGVEFLSEVKKHHPDSMRLILSGYSDLNAVIEAINRAEIYRFVSKPWNDYELVAILEQALAYHDVWVENKLLADQVRRQNSELNRRKAALDHMRARHPALFDVSWGPDGQIMISDEDM